MIDTDIQRTRVCTLEFPNGLRVGVDMIEEFTHHETHRFPPVKIKTMVRFETCGGQPVVPHPDDRRATVMTGGKGGVDGVIVEEDFRWGSRDG